MAEPTLSIASTADRRAATLRFTTEDATVEMTISAQELDTMIYGLAAARAHLTPSVPTTHLNAPTHSPVAVQAVVPAERIGGKRLILFRHPGFGWLAFELGWQEGEGLAAGIMAAMRAEATI